MSAEEKNPPPFVPPVSTFAGPVAELIALRMLQPPSRPGLLAVLDQYEILRLLGGGGMGIVLLARDAATGHEVAVKLVRSDLVANQNVVHRFLREAGHLKRLRHTNVVPVEAISDRAEGPYFVMPFFDKGSLANRIRPGIPLDTESILDIAAQVAEGLSFAHRSGIIHRDLKPANILLAANGRACLADFGLARTLFNDTIVDIENRNLEGTAPYMSPAVAAGDVEDTRCDIYSFGALLYEMLTGEPPYKGRGTKEILDQIIAGPPKPVTSLNPDADRGLVAVAEGCMARELRDRYADMRDVLKDLERLKLHKPPAGHRGLKGRAVDQLASRRAKIVLVPVCLAVVAALVWFFWPGRVSERQTPANPVIVVTNPPAMPVAPVAPAAPVAATTPVPATTPIAPVVPVVPVTNAPPAPPRPAVLTVSTFAGQAEQGGYADGTGTEAEFRLPNSLAADSAGNVYVADTANNTIRKIDPDGVVTTIAGLPGSHGSEDGPGTSARFWAPFGIAVDGAGNVYVADTGNNTIRKISPDGIVSTIAGSAGHPGSADGLAAGARFRNPWGVAVDTNGNVYVADMSNDTIRKIHTDGQVVTVAGQAGTTGSADGFGTNAWFNNPFALAVDAAGNIYVADSGNNVIRKITPGRVVHTLAGLPGNAGSTDASTDTARFWNPQGLAVDSAGNIYVADTGNNTVRKITPMGEVTTLAGLPGVSGTTDGVGSTARFNAPGGVAVDPAGNIYVADTSNHTIRKIAPADTNHPDDNP
jgi:sugar lactone lactonase YvrE